MDCSSCLSRRLFTSYIIYICMYPSFACTQLYTRTPLKVHFWGLHPAVTDGVAGVWLFTGQTTVGDYLSLELKF